jgi:glucosylceramidase
MRKLSAGLTALVVVGCLVALVPSSPAASRRTARHRPRPNASIGSPVQVVQTTASLFQRLTPLHDVWFTPGRPKGIPVINVDDRVRYQRVTGFGAALTDSSAWLIHDELAPPARAAVMDALFSRAGIHLDFLRLPIGASDFTAGGRPDSYDDLPPGQTDPQLRHFSVAHDDAYIVPTLRQMVRIDPRVQTLATPWSPPPWMKTNESFDNLDRLGSLHPWAYQPFADYIVKFIQAYAARGIPIDAVTPQNEPQAGSPFPGLELSPADEAALIVQNLEPALRAAGLHPKIYGADRGAQLYYPQGLLSSPARSALAGIAWHCYGGMDAMSTVHREDPGLPEILSECSPGIIPYSVSEVAIDATRNWASAVGLWNLALDPAGGPVQVPNTGCSGCTGLVTISEQTQAATFGLGYYQLGQVSRFVEPGAFRIRSDRFVSDFQSPSGVYGVTPGLDDVAFLNPGGERVLVAYDNSSAPVQFAVQWHGRSFVYRLRPWATVTFTWPSTA